MQQNNSAIKHLIKPFSFELPQSEQFNPLLLDNLNWDYVQANLDIAQCGPFLKNFVQSNFTSDTIRNMEFRQFKKMLEVCQFAMDFYTQNQEQKEIEIDEKVQVLRNKQEQLEKLKEIEKQHIDKQNSINKELELLKAEAKKVKEQAVKNIIFKCHHCDKCYTSKQELLKHIDNKHVEKQKDDITNPEYLGSMLQQLQQQQTQQQQSMANTQQSFMKQQQFGNTMQSMPDPLMIGSAGFQQLKQQQIEKMEQKQRRKEERRIKRENDREERQKRILQQEEQMKQFQNQMKVLIEQKVQEMVKLNNMVGSQQQAQIIQQKKLIAELEELKQMKFVQKEQSIIQLDPQQVNQSKSNDDEKILNIIDKEVNDLDISQQSLHSQQLSRDQKLQINKNQKAGDQSGMMSFHNYSYSQNSQNMINVKTEMGKAHQIKNNQLNVAEMAHVGEIESDNEVLDQDGDASYLRPVNKKSEVQQAEIEFIEAIRKKKILKEDPQDDDDEDDRDFDDLLNKEKQKLLGPNTESQTNKELLESLNKIQQLSKDKS
ncbi:unnamed protein product [Paramecium octaurelia]|uniref:C2H2-type domain-containing protein n=1 Tax=Paramecium octaurelia TaxID=43137 RepID=A0A8S1XFL1_PAROT|nr:unnamed protein product [Paramecium octaurelia]